MMERMSSRHYTGRIPWFDLVVAFQAIDGIVHIPSGVLLIFADVLNISFFQIASLGFGIPVDQARMAIPPSENSLLLFPISYFLLKTWGLYTFFYGILCLIFAYGLWIGNRWGWIGTVATSVFVIFVDSITALGVTVIPGVPEFAGIVEIPYSLAIILYLIQPHVKNRFLEQLS